MLDILIDVGKIIYLLTKESYFYISPQSSCLFRTWRFDKLIDVHAIHYCR